MMVTRLPTERIDGKEYFIDDRLQEYRAVDNPHERITFEEYGKKEAKAWGIGYGVEYASDACRDAHKPGDEFYPDEGLADVLMEHYLEVEPQMADYSNNLLPDMRRLAGCKDSMKVGTYTDCTSEQFDIADDLIELYTNGVYEGIDSTIRAKKAIDSGDTIAHDVAANKGQKFDNVKKTRWFLEAVAHKIREDDDG